MQTCLKNLIIQWNREISDRQYRQANSENAQNLGARLQGEIEAYAIAVRDVAQIEQLIHIPTGDVDTALEAVLHTWEHDAAVHLGYSTEDDENPSTSLEDDSVKRECAVETLQHTCAVQLKKCQEKNKT